MRDITIYCSARDQDVHVLVDHDPLDEGEPSLLESELYCLEIGHACSGAMCPLGAEPPAVLAASLADRATRPEAGHGGIP